MCLGSSLHVSYQTLAQNTAGIICASISLLIRAPCMHEYCTLGHGCMHVKQADSAGSADPLGHTGIAPEGGNAIFGAVKGLMPITTRLINGVINLGGGQMKHIKQSHMKMQVLPNFTPSNRALQHHCYFPNSSACHRQQLTWRA